MKKVVFIDKHLFGQFAYLEERVHQLGGEVAYAEKGDEDYLAEFCKDADAVIVVFSKVTEKVINAMEHCSMILRTGIGVDNIDVEAATKKGIQVSFVPDYCRDEVADHTLALVLDATRKISVYNKYVKEDWAVKSHAGYVPRLQQCKACVLSFGNIGKKIARRLQGFGIQVAAYDPFLSDDVFESLGVERKTSTDDLIADADILILTGPLTPENFHLINRESLKLMKKTAFLINTGRGAMVDETALIEALKNNDIAGAAVDVLENEPPADKSIFELDNLIITGHMAYYSAESMPDLIHKSFDEAIRAIQGQKLNNCVNAAELKRESATA